MSSSSTTKNKASKDKVSMIKLAKSNQLSSEMQMFKISLNEVIKDYEPKVKAVYQDAVPSKTRLPKDDERVHCPVIIIVLESVHKQVIKAISWKHFPLGGEAFPIYLSFSEKYLTINSLKFEDAHFQEADIKLLAAFLQTNPNVNDLNLSGNAYNKNFKCLIQETKLKYLTLKFCGINHENLKEFVEPMENSYKQPLLYLNLANNNIGDEGARILAVVLRVNRILLSLNVSANGISDKGAREILGSLQMFYLDQDEISIRRKIFYQYYMKKYEEMAANSPATLYDAKTVGERSSSTSVTRLKNKPKSTKNRNRKSSKSAASLSEQSTKSFTTPRDVNSAPAPFPSITLPYADSSDLIANLDFHSAYHPFVKETTLNGFRFLCRGNFVLTHLNLSFNQLSTETLRYIQEVLKYQLSNGLTEEGLKSVGMFGNDMKSEEADHLQCDISEMFTRKTSRTGSSVTLSSKETLKKQRRLSK